ncbi:hypothetical protein BURMUCGD2M_5422 [Burkholderia multivorans CGD2M]|jgi:hypothetical protein|nr:hypothetical protein BURMUCGD2M_5422 [Burkholderia multivorans CGD2M]
MRGFQGHAAARDAVVVAVARALRGQTPIAKIAAGPRGRW